MEETRSGVINKKNKISLVDVEAMALTLSKCSKTVTLLKQAFPTLEANIKANPPTVQNPDKRRMTEDFLKRTPDRMENIWRRCKKLTGKWKTLIFEAGGLRGSTFLLYARFAHGFRAFVSMYAARRPPGPAG